MASWVPMSLPYSSAAPATLAAPARGLVVACHPCRWPSRSRSPLQEVWPCFVALAKGLAMAGHPLSSLLPLRKHSKNA
ncbi:hypothetical protein GW17_00048947 [Ensete ventricosum]|nr:hypothetical protein GW17_00048947 [Ensete ventricosum]